MAWVAEQTFEALSNGDLNGQAGGTGFTGNWSGSTNYDVESTVAYEGSKGVINNVNANADITATLTSAVSGAFVVYFAMRRGSTSAGQTYSKLRSAGGNRCEVIFQDTGNVVAVNSGVGLETIITGYVANTWYVFRVTGNTTAGTYTVAYSTDPYGSAGTFSAESISLTMGSTGDITAFRFDRDASTANDYWDYISPTTPFPAPSGPTNLKSLDTNVKANIKSYNTNVLANIKSINTNA